MAQKDAYIVIDIGTGNVRVVVVNPAGEVLGEARDDIQYKRDDLYPESIFFEPAQLWNQIVQLGREALAQSGPLNIRAFTGTSQREGIVLISATGESLIGLPNIDHRGREWESIVADKDRMYRMTGRFPTSLFSALKLVGIRERRKEIWNNTSAFLSISDWVEFQLSGIAKYEHSQASETLLYDVEKKQWSDELISVFDIKKSMLPPLYSSASGLGKVLPRKLTEFGITGDAVVITGGGDTQLAIKSTQPAVDDFVIVSGTTTPVVKLVDHYITDTKQRTWTSRDITPGNFVFEANAGVTGLNYQRLKEVFYPNEGYEVIEKELAQKPYCRCSASLGSLVATDKTAITRGGFIFPAPVSHELSRSCFVWATLLDIGFSIAENYKVLRDVAGHAPAYVWACGGGLQSKTLRQIIANIIGKNVQVRQGFRQSSAVGGALVCNEALGLNDALVRKEIQVEQPGDRERFEMLYNEWLETRNIFRKSSE